jgi:insulysin
MLFEGSKKYPDLGKFDDLVSATGGYTNAYTEATNTNYYFTVGTASLTKTLDVFSHFFIDPLFSNNAVEKEVNAVNSEYEIDTSGDSWKLMNIFTLISDKTHP